jgi:hypothetical protein
MHVGQALGVPVMATVVATATGQYTVLLFFPDLVILKCIGDENTTLS